MKRRRYSLTWKLARIDPQTKVARAWVPASVPGGAQLDWARASGLPDYRFGDNVRQWKEMENSAWLYRGTLADPPELAPGERLFLVVRGVDCACDASIDGRFLTRHEGMQTPLELDVTACWRAGSEADILVHPTPKAHDAPEDRSQARASCKPAVAYGWDFHPRLIPLGLWRETYLERRSGIHFATPPEIRYSLNADCSAAEGRLEVFLNESAAGGMFVRWMLKDSDDREVLSSETKIPEGRKRLAIPFVLSSVDLWWPHDQGRPTLYSCTVELHGGGGMKEATRLDADSCFVGFRKVRLVMAHGQWEKPNGFPKSRSHPPITLEINGRSIFAKGSNWVCPDIFPGTLTESRYTEQLTLAQDANLNLLRVWGGAAAPHDWFFETCDRLGIMVWQEFPLACNDYPDDPLYLAQLDRESRSLIERLRPHPSVVLWCGGNELFNAWSGMTDQSRAIRLLNRNCYDLDPDRPFIPTAPVDGMGHGHYIFRDPETGKEAWELFQGSSCTAYSEFGCPGPASVETLKEILPGAELWPPRPGTAWETHHAFGAWKTDSWLDLPQIEHYFGPQENLDDLVRNGQLLQAAGFQGLFEEARRQKPAASMALNWCFNEPWPCAANNSLISWPCRPKPALKAVGQACRPTLASARITKFSWKPGENFDPELWILHDGPEPLEPASVTAWIECDGRKTQLLTWTTGAVAANANLRGPRAQFLLHEFAGPLFVLHLEVEWHPEWNSTYTLLKSISPPEPLSPEEKTRALNF